MKSLPVFSVILTTYNSEKTILNTLESITGQRGLQKSFNLELLIVDDCSSDRTIEILQGHGFPFLQTDANSGGPNKGRNIGLSKATGDYICIADHDDLWVENKLITMLPLLENSSIVTCLQTVMRIEQEPVNYLGQVTPSEKDHISFYGINETFMSKLCKAKDGQNTYLSCIIFSEKLKKIKFEESFGTVDYDWTIRLFHDQRSAQVNLPLNIRLVGVDNLSLNERHRIKDYYYSLYAISDFEEKYPQKVRDGMRRINGTMARYYYRNGQMRRARRYLRNSGVNWKTIGYFITSYVGSTFVNKHFKVFG